MCQCSAGDIIDTNLRKAVNIFSRNISRALGLCTSINDLDGFCHIFRRHIVKHNDIGTGLYSLFYHIKILNFDLNLPYKWRVLLRHLNRFRHTSGSSDVIVFQKHTVGKVITVIVSTSDLYGIFFKYSHIRCRLSRIQKLCLGTFQQFCD